MIRYKIEGLNSTFESSEENFTRDCTRWLQRNKLSIDTKIEILDDNIESPPCCTDPTTDGNRGISQLNSLSENITDPKPVTKRQSRTKATHLSDVLKSLDKSDIPNTD